MTSTLSDFAPLITKLEDKVSLVSSILATATNRVDVISYSQALNYAEASLALISNEQVLQTATATDVIASATSAAVAASEALSSLYLADNLYGMTPSLGGNLALAIVMGIFFAVHSAVGVWARTWWFGISYFCGCGLEMAGYIGRTLSNSDPQNINYFLLQIIALTLAPVFVMAGIYYLLAQLVIIYGEKFAILKPLHYSFIFITCDVISLVIQAAGGGIAAVSLTQYESADTGSHIMVAGLAFQVVSMSVFIFFLTHFLYKIKFLNNEKYKALEPQFNPKFAHLRKKQAFVWFPVGIFASVIFIYIRCIYRVVELAEGWNGYLITHEVYIFVLDAMMVCLAVVVFIPFHPGIVYAKKTPVHVDKKRQLAGDEKNSQEASSDIHETDVFSDREAQVFETAKEF